MPLAQRFFAWQVVHVATDQNPLQVLPAVREQVRALDAELPLINVKTMATHIREGKGMMLFKLASGLVGSFGVIGLVLGAIGLYGVMAFSVTQRTHEIGVRMALGASTGSILGMVLRHGLALTLAGIALGLAGAFALTRFFANLLVGVTPTDPATFAGVAVFLVAVALLAAYVPARRAAGTDPLAALRYE